MLGGELAQQRNAGGDLTDHAGGQLLEILAAQLATPDRRSTADERLREGSLPEPGDLRQRLLTPLDLLGHPVLQDERDGTLRLESHAGSLEIGDDGVDVLEHGSRRARGLRVRARLRPDRAQTVQSRHLALERGRPLRDELLPAGQLRAARLPGLCQPLLDADRRPLFQDLDGGFELGTEFCAHVEQASLDGHDRRHRRCQRFEVAQEIPHLGGLRHDLRHGDRHGRRRSRRLRRRRRCRGRRLRSRWRGGRR